MSLRDLKNFIIQKYDVFNGVIIYGTDIFDIGTNQLIKGPKIYESNNLLFKNEWEYIF